MTRSALVICVLSIGCGNTVIVQQPPDDDPPVGCEGAMCAGAEVGEKNELWGPCECDDDAAVVTSASELQAAQAAGATCIVARPGNYREVQISTKVVGSDLREVLLQNVLLDDGAEACRFSAGTITMATNASATIRYAHVQGEAEDGITVSEGAALSASGVTVEDVSRYGISAFDTRTVTIQGALIRSTDGPGIWSQCGEFQDCGCDRGTQLSLSDTRVIDTSIVGVNVSNARASLDNVVVEATTVGSSFEAGGGISVSFCADVRLAKVATVDNADFGVFVFDSGAVLSGVTIERNLRGMWLMPGNNAVEVISPRADANRGMAIGISSVNGAFGEGPVMISDAQLRNTTTVALPVIVNGVSAGIEDFGEGIYWNDGVTVDVKGAAIEGSGRYGVLIRGPANGSLHDVKTADDIVQICGGPVPDVTGATPPIQGQCE